MAQRLTIKSPLKGINRSWGREDQPQDSCVDALNVIPLDRYGRMRVAQRSGTDKLWDTAIGSGNPILMLEQAVVAADPFAVTPGATVTSDTFDYSNGALQTVSGGVWTTYAANSTSLETVNELVNGGRVEGTSGTGGHAFLTSTPALDSTYIVRMVVRFDGVNGNQAHFIHTRALKGTTNSISVLAYSPSGSAHDRLTVVEGTTSASAIIPDTGTANLDLGSVFWVAGVDYILEIAWNGNAYTVSLDGVVQMSGTTTLQAAHTHIGFAVPAGDDGSVAEFQTSSGIVSPVARDSVIVAVANTNIYMGTPSQQATIITAGTAAMIGPLRPSMATLFGFGYMVNGFDTAKKIDIENRAVVTYTLTGGSETVTTLGKYQIAVNWRGRLVLGADVDAPQNFIASKVGDPSNWDYTGTGPDTAFAGNASTAGRIGDPITALMPASDDVLLIGGDHNLWKVVGDPADGGSINIVSDSIGVFGQTAWCKSPNGDIYFVGTTGLFRIDPAGNTLENISRDSYNQFFTDINRRTQYVNLEWDRDRHGCYVFVTDVATGESTHLFYDARREGFWQLRYPDSHGPISALVYDGDGPTDRFLLLGGRTGYVQTATDPTIRTDDGTAITSFILLGPVCPMEDNEVIVLGTTLNQGELSTSDAGQAYWTCSLTLRAGKSPADVSEGTPTGVAADTFTADKRTKTMRQRLKGEWFVVRLASSTSGRYFSMESVELEFQPVGRNRRQG